MTTSGQAIVQRVADDLEAVAAALKQQSSRGGFVQQLVKSAKALYGLAEPRPATEGR